MGSLLVPELHDIGKLCFINKALAGELGLEEGSPHSKSMTMKSLPAKLGVREPATDTWRGIIEHNPERGAPSPQDLDIVLLIAADHAGSGLSRMAKASEEKPVHRTVHKLWNPADQRELTLLGSKDELRSLIQWLSTDPDRESFFQRYGDLLSKRPEELRPPLNATSLHSHLTIVGKIYRFLTARQAFYAGAQAKTPESVEHREVDLVRAQIDFPQQIVRTRDMALFALMSQRVQQLATDDRVLVATFHQLLAILSPEETVESLLGPLAEAGYRVSWQKARVRLGSLASVPSELRREKVSKLRQELAGLAKRPDVPSTAYWRAYEGRWKTIDDAYAQGILVAPLDNHFGRICDLCQMEPASRVWPEEPDARGPWENIGERCYRLRKEAAPRLYKLDRWTEEPSARVAWVYVGLDLYRLVGFLKPLYQEYARATGSPPELIAQIDVRPPLLAEFQKDYRQFLADFAAAAEEWIGADNLERAGGETGEAANTLFCLRLESAGQIATLLRLYLDGVKSYFPLSLEGATALKPATAQPFRLAVSVSGVKFPFSEHWRTMQEETADVLINVIGRGQVRAPLPSLPILIAAGEPSRRTALHNLAEVAKVSEALAQVYVQNRDEKHYQEYQSLIAGMQPLRMTYESLLTYAKLLEG